MTIPELQEKVNKAQETVAKIENTIEKHKIAREKKILALNKLLEQNGKTERYDDIKDLPNSRHYFSNTSLHHDFYWAMCDIGDKDDAIESNLRKLEDAKKIVENWQTKLRAEEVKLQYIQDRVPQIIKDFLEQWKRDVIHYYTQKSEEYPEAKKTYKAESEKLFFEILKETVERLVNENRDEFIEKYCWNSASQLQRVLETLNGPYKEDNSYQYRNIVRFRYRDPLYPENDTRYVRLVDQFESRFGDAFFKSWIYRDFDKDWLEKEIEQEKNNKLIDLMTRVSKITGEITDASNLHLTAGNLNGYIIGVEGSANVETIGAGGYNIQCYHYRTLIKPRK